MSIQEAREALAELQSLHAQGWCACRSSSLPSRVEQALKEALDALDDELEALDALPPAPGVDPFETGRKPLIIADRVIGVPLTPEANYALHEWIGNNLDSLAEALAPHGLQPADIQKPTYTRVVYEDELQQARWVIAAEATNEAVQQLIDATPGRIIQLPHPITSSTALAVCPECRDGKHQNCTDLALDRNDEWVSCSCECRAA